MSFMTGIKANKAYRLQKSGATEEAKRLYDECFAEGLNDARFEGSCAVSFSCASRGPVRIEIAKVYD